MTFRSGILGAPGVSRRSATKLGAQPREAGRERPPQAELPDQRRGVGHGPVLDDLAVREATDGDARHADAPARATAREAEARRNPVALGHLVLDLDRQVSKEPLVELHGLADPLMATEHLAI